MSKSKTFKVKMSTVERWQRRHPEIEPWEFETQAHYVGALRRAEHERRERQQPIITVYPRGATAEQRAALKKESYERARAKWGPSWRQGEDQ